jgi:uncharacterized protein YcfJ
VVPGIGTAIGGVAGAVIGAVAGGYAGKYVAEGIFPTEEEEYWRGQFESSPYYDASRGYNYDTDYRDAYRFGYIAAYRYPGVEFDEVETQLADEWTREQGTSRLAWPSAREAARESWQRARRGQEMPDENP